MEYALAALSALLLAALVFERHRHSKSLIQTTELFERIVARQIDTTHKDRELDRIQVSEMATRIQHPEIYRPDITVEPQPPIEPDEYESVGIVVPGEPEGEPEENGSG